MQKMNGKSKVMTINLGATGSALISKVSKKMISNIKVSKITMTITIVTILTRVSVIFISKKIA